LWLVLLPTPVFVVVIGELGVGSNAAAEGDTVEGLELDTSVKNVDSATGSGPDVGEGSLDVVHSA